MFRTSATLLLVASAVQATTLRNLVQVSTETPLFCEATAGDDNYWYLDHALEQCLCAPPMDVIIEDLCAAEEGEWNDELCKCA